MSAARTKIFGVATIMAAMVLCTTAAQAQSKGKHPAFHALMAAYQGTYRDDAMSERTGIARSQGETKLTGTEVQIAGAYKNFELELANRMLTPEETPWWTQRNELFLTASYYWRLFPYVQPVLGLTQMTQGGDQDHEDAPPAFIDTNTAAILGLRSSVALYTFKKKHGVMAQGRMAYHTSFEAQRNFGDEGYAGLGYFFAKGRFRAALVGGQVRNFFRAEKPDPEAEGLYLVVRHTYVANRIGLYIEY